MRRSGFRWFADFPSNEASFDTPLARTEVELLSRDIAEILADEDLMRITDGNPDPVGEYSGEAAEIARRVTIALRGLGAVDREFIAGVVADVFKSEFEVDIEPGEGARIAARIEAAMG
jgi:hypothetical protein